MSRVQLALRVADLEGSVAFYSKLFGAEPAKRRPGYANFAIAEPPLKLVLIEGAPGEPTRMDHLGVEVATTDDCVLAGLDRRKRERPDVAGRADRRRRTGKLHPAGHPPGPLAPAEPSGRKPPQLRARRPG